VSIKNTVQHINSSGLLIFLGLSAVAVALAFATVKFGITFGALIIVVIVGGPILFIAFSNVKFGFYLVLVLTFFISYINRMSNQAVPILAVEIILIIVIMGFFLQEISNPRITKDFWNYYKNPVAIALLIWVIYNHLQFLNPNSSIVYGKIIAIRQSWFNLLGFTVALYVFSSIVKVKNFLKVVIGISLLAAFYGLSQKYIGLLPYDREWLYSDPIRVNLFVIWTEIRAWSFMNDPTNFGLLMASSGIICFILITGPYSLAKKVLLAVTGTILFLAMVSSGTRTAFVIVLVGFGMFGLLNIKSLRTQIISISVLFISLIIYFGPFYSASVIRIRSAFEGSDDPSMNVRLINKQKIQPYLLSHPFGGGPYTTGESKDIDHPLWGFPPDSGFLKVALELGYVGLIITLWLYYRASSHLTSQFFQTDNQEKKVLYLAILASMIALYTAELTQMTASQKPFDFIFCCYYALIIRLKDLPGQ
jgi:putative inorganic carbon (hco3(-)) transporter